MTHRYPVQTLAEISEVFADGDWVESKDQAAAGIRLIQTGNVGLGVFKARDGKARYVSGDTYKRLRCTEIFEGDCLISRLPDPVGRACLIPDTGERMITAVDCTIVRFRRDVVLPAFFGLYSQSTDYLEAVNSQTTGATRSRISRSSLGRIPVPVPPIPEQRRIVTVLDEAFAAIATARANTEHSLRNAGGLYGRVLDDLFSRGIERWGKCRVGELAETVTKGTTPTSIGFAFEPEGPVNFVKVESISAGGTVIQERLAKISVECHEALRRSQLRENDVLFSIAGALGRTAIVGADLLPANTNQALAIIRLKPSADVLPEFLVRALGTSVTEAQTELNRAGAAQQNLSLAQLRGFELPVPERAEQEHIVGRLREVQTLTDRLALVLQRKLAALDALKQSLLHQAFTGAL